MTILKRIYGPILEARLYAEALYLLLGFAFGILWFTLLITLYGVGIATVVIWVGVVILVGTQALLRPIGAIERVQVRWLLGRTVPAPRPLSIEPVLDSRHPEWSNMTRWSGALLHDVHSWRVLAWACLRMVLGPVGFSFALVYLVVPVSLIMSPIFGTIDVGGPDPYRWQWLMWFGPLAALIVTPGLAWVVRGLADLHRWMADRLLGPCGDELRRVALARASRAEEQIRIDQELHDSIGHMVSMIVVQAGAGAHVFDKDPAFARRALANIEERGRAALGELDRIIARIRGDQPETLTPLPGAAEVPSLVEGAARPGSPSHRTSTSAECPPPSGAASTACSRRR